MVELIPIFTDSFTHGTGFFIGLNKLEIWEKA
jgi:hypothetical protein